MKCKACDEILNDKESARKYLHIDEYLDQIGRAHV